MLAIMTYNVWVVVATVCGVGVGYFICTYAFRRKPRQNCAEGTCSIACSDIRGGKIGQAKLEQELEPLQGETDMCTECRETDI